MSGAAARTGNFTEKVVVTEGKSIRNGGYVKYRPKAKSKSNNRSSCKQEFMEIPCLEQIEVLNYILKRWKCGTIINLLGKEEQVTQIM